MGFDDYFETRNKYRRFDNHREMDHHSEHGYPQRYSGSRGMEHYGFYILNKIWNNSKLRFLFIAVALIVVAIVILLIIAIFPLIVRIVDSIAQTGLKGITESVTGFIEKLWSGSGS
jgi:hypothetical protein